MKIFLYAFIYQCINADGTSNMKAVRFKYAVLSDSFESAEKKCDALLASKYNDLECDYQGRELIETLSRQYVVI